MILASIKDQTKGFVPYGKNDLLPNRNGSPTCRSPQKSHDVNPHQFISGIMFGCRHLIDYTLQPSLGYQAFEKTHFCKVSKV